MNIFIAGGLGFVGRHLTAALLDDGHQVTVVGHSSSPSAAPDHPEFSYLAADTTQPGTWMDRVAGHEAVINLVGRSIFTLWTKGVKKEIYDSRVLTTRNLVQSLTGAPETLFISTSAVGFYGDRGEDVLREDEPPGNDFLATVCKAWEHEARQAQSDSVRVVLTRLGIVLDRDGGAMASMIPAFKFFLGGRLGSGRQWFPWVHLHDLISIYRFILDNAEIVGPINCCTPQPVRNRDLTRTLAEKLNRPVMLPTPAPVVKTVLGEFGAALICSQRGEPRVLQQAGYQFDYPDIDRALDEITRR